MKIRLMIFLVIIALPLIAAEPPSDAEIRKTLADRIDVQKQAVGMVVGIIDPNGRRIVAYGPTAIGSDKPVNADTLFEIGSMTKVFTALVLADMVQKGEVALTDPVAKFLPSGVKMPARDGKVITLEDLATHTSGLPRLPTNLAPKDPTNPYADYTPAELYAFLSSYELTRDIGSRYEYSNLGGGLLGHVLALRAGTDYETLVRSRILDPLGMKSTTIHLSEAATGRLAKGYNAKLQPVPNWDFSALAGAGALRSTANDVLTFLSAAMGLTKTPLSNATAAMTSVRRKTDMPNVEIALGWHISTIDGREIVWHNGGTGGYRSFMGYDAQRHFGVVALSNTFTPAGVDDIGMHLLAPSKQRQEMKLDAAVLERYVGNYQLAPQFVLTVTREGDRLFVQATGQPKFEVFASGERDFFYKVVEAQLTFEFAGDDHPARVILHQNGRDVPGARVP